MISNQFSPHFDFKDSLHAVACLVLPRVSPPEAKALLSHVPNSENFEIKYGNSARTMMGEWAKAMGISKEKMIGIPAYFCAVGAVPFLDLGYDILWLDVLENGTVDPQEVEKNKERLGAVVVAHNFGRFADVNAISKICKPKGIKVLTDCAHGWSPQLEFADAAVISFGREKVLSTVSGGALVWDKNHEDNDKLKNIKLKKPSALWTVRHGVQPIILNLAIKTWPFGKVFTHAAKKLKILPRAVYPQERQGRAVFPRESMPRAFYRILNRQMSLWVGRYAHAEKISDLWVKNLLELGFEDVESPINKMRVVAKHKHAKMIKKELLKSNIDLRDWEGGPISPEGVNYEKFGYTKGTCPVAEKISQTNITFPTHQRIKPKDVEKTINLIKKLL